MVEAKQGQLYCVYIFKQTNSVYVMDVLLYYTRQVRPFAF